MSLGKLFAMALATGGLLLAAPAAQAQLSRPDIPDVSILSTVQNSIVAPAIDDDSHIKAVVFQTHSAFGAKSTYMYGTVSRAVDTPVNTGGEIRLRLYGPDKIQRKADKTQLKQKTFLTGFVYVSTPLTSFLAYITTGNAAAVDCKGQVKIEHSNLGVVSGAKWNFQCKESVITSLGLTAPQLSALETLFGTTKKIKLSNKFP